MKLEELYRKHFNYDPLTGVVSWKQPTSNRVPTGKPLTMINGNGYVCGELNGKQVLAHRVAFACMGQPVPSLVDHKNRKRNDNRWKNLRPSTVSENVANAKTHADSLTGYKGVTEIRPGKFRARIRKDYKLVHLGYFNSPEQAHKAYVTASKRLFGAFAHAGA